MLALVEFVVWLLILPYVLFGLLLTHIAHVFAQVFDSRLLLAGVWFGVMGARLLPSRTPDDSRPFVSLVEMVAQSHIWRVPTPAALIGVAGILVVASAVVAFRRRQRAV